MPISRLVSQPVRFRLSSRQMEVIWPGIDFLAKEFLSRTEKKSARYAYSFQTNPPPRGFDRGVFHQELMNDIIALWKQMKPKSEKGGRVQMNAIQARAAIFAVRVNLGYCRRRRYEVRRQNRKSVGGLSSEQLKRIDQSRATSLLIEQQYGVDKRSIVELQIKSQRVIRSLERHMKRANRLLLKSLTRERYSVLMKEWRSHLRWMRLYLAYFKPLRPVLKDRKIRQQGTIDVLVEMADKGLRNQGYESPDAAVLRRMMRLYAASARRGRQRIWTIPFMLQNSQYFDSKWHLATFVMQRLDLKELPES